MLWIRLFLSCLLFESVTGSLAWAAIECRKRLQGEKDYFFGSSGVIVGEKHPQPQYLC